MKAKYLILPFLATFTFCSVSCKDAKTAKQEQEHKEATEDLERATKEFAEAQKKELEEEGALSTNPEALDGFIDAAKKMEDSSSGEEAVAAKVMRLFMESVQKDSVKIQQGQQALFEASDYSAVKSAADIDPLSAKVKAYQQANLELKQKVETGWTKTLRANLDKENISTVSKEALINGFVTEMNSQKPHLIVIRETDHEVCNAILEQHAILKKYFGKWHWDTADGTPQFTDDTALKLFNEQAIKIQQQSAKQVQAQTKLVNGQ